MGQTAPLHTALVLTGRRAARTGGQPLRADYVFENLGELLEAMSGQQLAISG